MSAISRSRLALVPSLPLTLVIVFLWTLFAAGGSARADVSGQVVVRTVATLTMIAAILFGRRPAIAELKWTWIGLAAFTLLPALQLIPLPPAVWQSLPGRELISHAAVLTGEPQPWRPISLVPGGTLNALFSLLIPLTTLLLVSQLKDDEHKYIPGIALSLIAASTLIGLMQFSGLRIASPFGDNGLIEVSGPFTNRNHFALLLAIGCAITPAWALDSPRHRRWRAPLAIGMIMLFLLLILASGSRAGLILGAFGLSFGIGITWPVIARSLGRYPRWLTPAVIAGSLSLVGASVFLSVASDRAVSIKRLFGMDAAQDMRSRALPTVMKMIETYFPAGSGYGGFDPLFRVHEPFEMLSPIYLNHAHNDLLEVILEGGMLGMSLVAVSAIWWISATVRAWRRGHDRQKIWARVGSSTILLIMAASLFDYPARTPLIMAVLVISAVWLSRASIALPRSGPLL